MNSPWKKKICCECSSESPCRGEAVLMNTYPQHSFYGEVIRDAKLSNTNLICSYDMPFHGVLKPNNSIIFTMQNVSVQKHQYLLAVHNFAEKDEVLAGFALVLFRAYCNDPKFSDRSAWANSADPDQTGPRGAVWSGSTLFAIPSASFGLISLW